MTKHWILVAIVLALAACGDHDAQAPSADVAAPAAAPAPSAPAAASPAAAPAQQPAPATPANAPLQVADLDACFRGMAREIELLQADSSRIEQARAAGDSDAETSALFHMTSRDIDVAGAQAAGMALPRYDFVKDQVDTVQSKLDMLDGLRRMDGDTSAMQARVGDPYAALAADVAAALKARQAEAAALRTEAIGLRVKAAGG